MLKRVAIALFLILAIVVAWFIYSYIKTGKIILISPFAPSNDQTEKIVKRIAPPLVLDFSTTKSLASLAAVPNYLVYNKESGRVYYAINSNTKIAPASFTKLLSTQVVLDFTGQNAEITATKDSINKVPTILGLKEGETFLVSDLLRGAIATSANDAAQTLADGAAKAVGIFPNEFIYYMNKKATLLGMNHSHFANPDGLDDQNQYSTLEDIARMVHNVQINYPEILAAGKSDREDIASSSAHGFYYLPNWNGLLGVYPGTDGLKIAYTESAGYSTIVTSTRENVSMVAIVSGTGSYIERDRAAADLLDAAFLAEGVLPANVTKIQLNRHYKVWGDLARQIRAELDALKKNK